MSGGVTDGGFFLPRVFFHPSARGRVPAIDRRHSGRTMEELHDVQLTEIKPLLTGQNARNLQDFDCQVGSTDTKYSRTVCSTVINTAAAYVIYVLM